jgi:sugar transferase (PEP-CTERM/EpsH1 system associated)
MSSTGSVISSSLGEGVQDVSSSADGGRIRVLHVVQYLGTGGTELALARIIKGLDARRFHHQVCTLRGCADLDSWARNLGQTPVILGGPEPGLSFPLRKLLRAINQFKPDVVHSRNWGALEAVLAARLAGIAGIVHSEHGYDHKMLNGLPLRRRLFRRAMYSLTTELFAVSSELGSYHQAQAWIGSERFRVIHNGIDVDRFCSAASSRSLVRRGFGISDSEVVIGWVGRMVPIKDVPTLLRASVSVIQRHPQVRILLVGSGPERERWESLGRECIELKDRLTFTGERDDIPEVLSAMDIFGFPSIREGISNTLLEAMASGLPVAASSCGGNGEVIEDGISGRLFEPGNAVQLSQLIEEFVSDAGLRARTGELARKRVKDRFSLPRMINDYSQLYTGVAQARKTAYVRN